MNEFYENNIVKRLENKKEKLKKEQNIFTIMCSNEMNSQCFERNAINDLIIMQQLKSEIEELEYLKAHMEFNMKIKEFNYEKEN